MKGILSSVIGGYSVGMGAFRKTRQGVFIRCYSRYAEGALTWNLNEYPLPKEWKEGS